MGENQRRFRLPVGIIFVLSMVIAFSVFFYSDISDTLDNAVMLGEATVRGRFFNYYEYAATNLSKYTAYAANYNVLLYVLFLIWNLPTFIIHMITEFDYMTSIPALMWCKGIVALSLVGIFIMSRKIAVELGADERRGLLAGFLSVSSCAVLMSAMIASQYDSIALFFMLCGMYFYLKKNTRMFVIMFGIAIPLKMFALFILLPLLLLREKNLLRAAVIGAITFIPKILCELPFRGDPYFTAALGSQNGDAAELILGSNLKLGDISLNLFVAAYFIICIFAYLSSDESGYGAVYYSFAVFAALVVLVPIRSYWLILYAPFLAILAALRPRPHAIGLLADSAAGFFGTMYFLQHHWIYNTGDITGSLLLGGVGVPAGYTEKYGSYRALAESLGGDNVQYAMFALFAGAIVFCLVIFRPSCAAKAADGAVIAGERYAVVLRVLLTIIVTAVLLYSAFASLPMIRYGSDDISDTRGRTDLLAGATATDTVILDGDTVVNELGIQFFPKKITRKNHELVCIVLTDSRGGVVFSDSCGVSLVREDEFVTFRMPSVKLLASEKYTLTVSCEIPSGKARGNLYPAVTDDGNIAMYMR